MKVYSSFVYLVTEENLGIVNHRLRKRVNPCILILERNCLILLVRLHLRLKNLDLDKLISFLMRLRPALDIPLFSED